MSVIQHPAAPNLPLAPGVYDPAYFEQYNNILRLYFNRLNNNLLSLFGNTGGQYIDFPNGLFFNTADQTFAAANTAYPVVFNATYLSNYVRLKGSSTSQIEVLVNGVYISVS